MTPLDVIHKKRDGGALTRDEITWFLNSYMNSTVTEYQMSAFLMAVYFQGMSMEETVALTDRMMHSGSVLKLDSIPGKKVDKHSTGGVGDKTSLIIVPIVAACGVTVPMITGRGLGHTGGTLDKLQSIPGFNPQPSPDHIVRILKKVGAVIMGQTHELAPLDRRLYALRDVTGTIESVPLITASITSKKLAEDIDGLIMDVKTGSGAFMKTREQATKLAQSIVHVCRKWRKQIVVVISDMDQPLGHAVGNALEVKECIEFLRGKAPADLEDLCLTLSAHMIRLGGRARTLAQARRMAYEAVSKGQALKRFKEIVRAQGGFDRVIDNPEMLPSAKHVHTVKAPKAGYVTQCDAKLVGLASNALGAGRNRLEDTIDPAVGIYVEKKRGDKVAAGETLCRVHWNDERRLREALPMIKNAYEIRNRPRKARPLVQAVLSA